MNKAPFQKRITQVEEQVALYNGIKLAQIFCTGLSSEAGWWKNKDGTLKDPHDPDIALSKIALMHSELSEATEGIRTKAMDDHLPGRPMTEVELADAIIRILDYSGKAGYDVAGAFVEKILYNVTREDHKFENRFKEGGKQI